MVLLDTVRSLKTMIVNVPDYLVNAVQVQVPEVTAISVYNAAAEAWLHFGESWADWLDDIVQRSFDDKEELWEAITDLIIDFETQLTEHFSAIVLEDEKGLYEVVPLDESTHNHEIAVIWQLIKDEV